MKLRRLFVASAIAAGASFLGCSNRQPDVVLRLTSPDQKVDALVLRNSISTGAAAVYHIQLVAAGGPPKDMKFDRFRADQVQALQLRWVDRAVLHIEYDNARIFHFSNFWISRDVEFFEHLVELQLRPRHSAQLGN